MRYRLEISSAAIAFILDRITKIMIDRWMDVSKIPVIDNVFSIVKSRNTGIAFGMFQGYNGVFKVVVLFAIIFIIYTYVKFKVKPIYLRIGFGLIIGGALGNYIDRYIHKHVIDFIEVGYNTFRWPAFNVADSCISIGLVLLILYFIQYRDKI